MRSCVCVPQIPGVGFLQLHRNPQVSGERGRCHLNEDERACRCFNAFLAVFFFIPPALSAYLCHSHSHSLHYLFLILHYVPLGGWDGVGRRNNRAWCFVVQKNTEHEERRLILEEERRRTWLSFIGETTLTSGSAHHTGTLAHGRVPVQQFPSTPP